MRSMARKSSTLAIISALLVTIAAPAYAVTSSTKSASLPSGSVLTVNKTVGIKNGEKIIVSGKHFDETVGIYVAMCKVVPKGELPTPCGGGADKTGATGSSLWISSNPPAYGVGLADPYLPGGRFSYAIKFSPMIGKLDCRKIACAVYVRADHTRGDDRSYDLKVPITFAK